MGPYPRPHFFISRPDHSITPLIAVDELPEYVRINGVPPVMTQADTQAMMSLGVKERSLGQYDVHVEYSGSSSCEAPVESCDTSASDVPSDKLHQAQHLPSIRKSNKHTEDNTADSSSIEIVQRSDLEDGQRIATAANEVAHGDVEGRKSANIEEWRQEVEVEPVDDIQTTIDSLVAAGSKAKEEVKESLSDENPRAVQAKAGLTPGKKVYCSHWIRTGECDFIQQGCLYKHEMPDDYTLNAIGVRSLPAWYVAAHPGQAHERGYGRGYASSNRTLKPQLTRVAGPPFTSPRMRSMVYPPSNQSPTFGFPKVSNATFFYPPAGFAQGFVRTPFPSDIQHHGPSPRFQELKDDRSPLWPRALQAHAGQLQLVPKPTKLKSPGYNTFPYPSPAPASAQPPPTAQHPPPAPPRAPLSATVKPQTNPLPVWEPRQPKYTNALIRGKEQSEPKDSAAQAPAQTTSRVDQKETKPCHPGPSASNTQISQPKIGTDESCNSGQSQSNRHNEDAGPPSKSRVPAINSLYAPLEPSPPLASTMADLPSRNRKLSNSSDLFALAPKIPSPIHPRLFVRPGGERCVRTDQEPKVSKGESGEVKEEVGVAKPKENGTRAYRKQRQALSPPDNGRPHPQTKNEKRKKTVLSPEKDFGMKQREREGDQASERLVDI
ncbi:MAG: hypothetical protein Q9216_002679 [Gyalolechia sp. 2 TL-2023]